MNRAQLAAIVSGSTLSPLVKVLAMAVIPTLGDDVFKTTIPNAVGVLKPLLEGKGQDASAALSQFVSQEERDRLIGLLDKFNGSS